jgi:hypothetical protein
MSFRVTANTVFEGILQRPIVQKAWLTATSKVCCGTHDGRVADAIIVNVPTLPGILQMYRTGTDITMKPIVIHAVDAHSDTPRMLATILDVADVRTLINQLECAIALVEDTLAPKQEVDGDDRGSEETAETGTVKTDC